jgi:hypothetical protein
MDEVDAAMLFNRAVPSCCVRTTSWRRREDSLLTDSWELQCWNLCCRQILGWMDRVSIFGYRESPSVPSRRVRTDLDALTV